MSEDTALVLAPSLPSTVIGELAVNSQNRALLEVIRSLRDVYGGSTAPNAMRDANIYSTASTKNRSYMRHGRPKNESDGPPPTSLLKINVALAHSYFFVLSGNHGLFFFPRRNHAPHALEQRTTTPTLPTTTFPASEGNNHCCSKEKRRQTSCVHHA